MRRHRYDKHWVGRVRERLARRLAAEGFAVNPSELYAAQGRERSDWHQDINRWNGFGETADDRHGLAPGTHVSFDSWDTMTACVRYGVVFDRDPQGSPCNFQVSANSPE